MTLSKIHDKNEVLKGASKILGGPSIRLSCLNLKYSYNLYIIIKIIIIIIIIRNINSCSFLKCWFVSYHQLVCK